MVTVVGYRMWEVGMKNSVLILFPSWGIGGSTIYFGQYVNSLIKSGHRVDCIYRKEDKGSGFLASIGGNVIISKYPLSLSLTASLAHNHLSMTLIVKNVFKLIYGFLFSTYVLLRRNPQTVFCEYTMIQCLLPAIMLKKKTVVFVQSDVSSNPVKRRIVEYFLNKSSHVVAITKLHLEPLRLNHSRFQVIHNMVYGGNNRKSLPLLNEINKVKRKRIITFVGGFNPHKGTEIFIEIIKRLKNSIGDYHFLLIGPNCRSKMLLTPKSTQSTNYVDDMYNLIYRYGIIDKMSIIGETNDICSYLAASDLLVSCNTFPHFMRPVIEAWAEKTPVIVTDDLYGSYLVEHKINGCIASDSIDSWVNNIQWIFGNERRRISMGLAGYEKYVKHFSEESFNAGYSLLLKNIT